MLVIDVNEQDANPFYLNTPEATYDLKLGIIGGAEHSASDLITKVTKKSPY